MNKASPRLILLYGLGLIAVGVMLYWVAVILRGPAPVLGENIAKGPGPQNPPEKDAEQPGKRAQPDAEQPAAKPKVAPALKGPTPEEVERKARAKAKLIDAKALGREANESLDALEKQLALWDSRSKTLLNDDAGKRFVDSPTALDQVDALLGRMRTKRATVDSLRSRLQSLLEPIETALRKDEGNYAPTAQLLGDIEGINKTAADANRDLERDNTVLQSLIADHAKRAPGAVTLLDALNKRKSEISLKEAGELAKAKAKAREAAAEKIRQAEVEATQKIAEAEAYAAKLLGEARAKELKEQADRQKKILEGLAEAERRKAEAEHLRKLSEDKNVQAKYQAFLAPGKFQFNSSQGGLPRNSERPEPVSFGELTKNGWLTDSKQFARALSKKPHVSYNWFNDRPVRAFPESDVEWKEIDRMLDEFRILGPVWVEMKLLRP